MSKKKSNEEVIDVKVNSDKKKENGFVSFVKENKTKCLFILLAVVLIIGIIAVVIKKFGGDDIKRVSKILPQKYYNIECLDSNCSGIAAYKGDKTKKSKVTLLNSNGKVVASYKDVYDPKAKSIKTPSAIGKDFFIFKKTNVAKAKVTGYSIANKRGKEVYSSSKVLKVLNDYLVVMDDTNKGLNSYTLLNSRGKTLFKNVNDFDLYADGKVISAEINGSKDVLNEKGDIILSDYYVATEVNDENGEVLYLLVEDSKNNSYNYFSLKSYKIVGDSFQNYSRNGDGTLTISKKENNNTVKYTLRKDGKQIKIGDSKTQSEIADDFRKTIDTKKYNLYLTSVYDKDQKYVFADDISSKAFGLYNIKSKKFVKVFDYKSNASSLYSSISKINNDKNLNFYQISCSTYNCDKNEFYVFDLETGKALYKLSDSKLRIQNYYQYGTDYKVIKYSYSSTNDEYKGKYVLYGKDNKEVVKSSNPIVVVDAELLVGNEMSSSLILYSAKAKKVLNSDKALGSKLTVDGNKIFRYQTDKNTILLNSKGKEVLKVESGADLIYSDKLIVYIKDKKAYMFNASTGKTKKYRFRNNEKMNDASGDLIAPYRGALFINNSANNYVRVVNSRGTIIKTIKKAEIQNIYKTKDNNVVIITKNDSKNITLFGLYIAK